MVMVLLFEYAHEALLAVELEAEPTPITQDEIERLLPFLVPVVSFFQTLSPSMTKAEPAGHELIGEGRRLEIKL